MIETLEPRRLLASEIRIDAGNNASYLDDSGHVWQGDTYYRGGEVKTSPFVTVGTSDPELFVSRREGTSFRYDIPLNYEYGEITVTILEAEPYFKQAGQRIFDVYAQGQKVISGWDLVASAGYGIPTEKSFQVNTYGGPLDLQFVGVKDEATVAAIDIVPTIAPGRPAYPVNAAASWDSKNQIIVNWSDPDSDQVNGTGYRVERSTDGGTYYPVFTTTNTQANAFLDTTVHRGHHYVYRIRAMNLTTSSLPAVATVATTKPWSPTPYSGKPTPVPGTILCENFDNGGNGISYYDTDISNDGPYDGPLVNGTYVNGDYRSSPVDLQPISFPAGEYEIFNVMQGEWLDYTISIPKAEQFEITTQYGSPGNGAGIHYDLDGKGITPEITLSSTGDFENYATVTTITSVLPKGTHVLRLSMDLLNDDGNIGNFQWIEFTPVSNSTTASVKSATPSPTSTVSNSSLFSVAPVEDNQIDQLLSKSGTTSELI